MCYFSLNHWFFVEFSYVRIFLLLFCLLSRCLLLLLSLEAHRKRKEDEWKNTKPNKQTVRKKERISENSVSAYHAYGLISFGLLFCVKLCKYIQSVCTWQREFSFFSGSLQINIWNIRRSTEWNWRNKSKCCYRRCNGKSLTLHYNKIHYISIELLSNNNAKEAKPPFLFGFSLSHIDNACIPSSLVDYYYYCYYYLCFGYFGVVVFVHKAQSNMIVSQLVWQINRM